MSARSLHSYGVPSGMAIQISATAWACSGDCCQCSKCTLNGSVAPCRCLLSLVHMAMNSSTSMTSNRVMCMASMMGHCSTNNNSNHCKMAYFLIFECRNSHENKILLELYRSISSAADHRLFLVFTFVLL